MNSNHIAQTLTELANYYDQTGKREVAASIDSAIKKFAQVVQSGEFQARQDALHRMNQIASTKHPTVEEAREYRYLASVLSGDNNSELFQQRLTHGGADLIATPDSAIEN